MLETARLPRVWPAREVESRGDAITGFFKSQQVVISPIPLLLHTTMMLHVIWAG